jgi:hypothetical protein
MICVVSVLQFLMCSWMLISTTHPDSHSSWLHHLISQSFSMSPHLQQDVRARLFMRTGRMWIWTMFTSTNIYLAQWVAFHIIDVTLPNTEVNTVNPCYNGSNSFWKMGPIVESWIVRPHFPLFCLWKTKCISSSSQNLQPSSLPIARKPLDTYETFQQKKGVQSTTVIYA